MESRPLASVGRRRSLQDQRPRLSVQPAPLIGRGQDLVAACRLLAGEARLLTLTGPAGAGKTRLALALAAKALEISEQAVLSPQPSVLVRAQSSFVLSPWFPDGVFFVDLAPISDPHLVLPSIAQALDVRKFGSEPPLQRLQHALQSMQLLLVLDNFEQVLGAAPELGRLLGACPGLVLLVTSREPLHLRWEHELPVSPLAVPEHEQLEDLAKVAQAPAVALFVERARAVRPDFALTPQNAADVGAICIRLDGLPLAIELAAARSKLLPPRALLGRLERRISLLTGGARDLPVRHQTLRAALDWSYDLLEPAEQQLFRRLGVFVDGCTLDGAQGVGCRVTGVGTLDVVAALLDKSLLSRDERTQGEPRYRTLETIREYALERLTESGEVQETKRRHAAYCLALAEAALPELTGPRQADRLDELEREHGNLRAALAWSLVDEGSAETGLRLCSALWRFWSMRGHLSEGREWLARVLVLPLSAPQARARAVALFGAGRLAYLQGDTAAATAAFEERLAIGLNLNDQWLVPGALIQLGHIASSQGSGAIARSYYEKSLTIGRGTGDKRTVAISLNGLGRIVRDQGDEPAACSLLLESLALAEELGDRSLIALSLQSLGELASDRHDLAEARRRYEEALTICRDLHDRWRIASVLEGFAGLAAVQNQPQRALCLAGAAAALRDALGTALPTPEQMTLNRQLAPARQRLGPAAAAAWRAGQQLSEEQSIACARQDSAVPFVALPVTHQRQFTDLTTRESEVLRLVADGKSNRAIAAELTLSERTVVNHMSHIFAKLDVESRAAAAAFAHRHKLL